MDEKNKIQGSGKGSFKPAARPLPSDSEELSPKSHSISWGPKLSSQNQTTSSPVEEEAQDKRTRISWGAKPVERNTRMPSVSEEAGEEKITRHRSGDDDLRPKFSGQPAARAPEREKFEDAMRLGVARSLVAGQTKDEEKRYAPKRKKMSKKKIYHLILTGMGLLTGVVCLIFLINSGIDWYLDMTTPSDTGRPPVTMPMPDDTTNDIPDTMNSYIAPPFTRLKADFQYQFKEEVRKISGTADIHSVIYSKRIENDPLSFINLSEEQYNSQFASEDDDSNTVNQILDKVQFFIIPIYNSQIDSRLQEMEQARLVVGQGKFNPAEMEAARKKILTDLYNTAAVGFAGLDAFDSKSARIEAYKKDIRDRFPTEDAYKKWVKDFYQDEKTYDTWLRLELAGGIYLDDIRDNFEVPEDEISDFYLSNQQNYEVSERIRLYQIFLRVTDSGDAATSRAHQKENIDSLMSRIENGESFERLAEKFSGGGNAIIDIERGELPKSMEQVIFSLEPGRISSVYESNRGFHIFKMVQYVPQHVLTLDAVRPQIVDRLRNDRFEAAYPEIIKKLQNEMVIKS